MHEPTGYERQRRLEAFFGGRELPRTLAGLVGSESFHFLQPQHELNGTMNELAVCRDCALDVLPRLIADSVMCDRVHKETERDVFNALKQITGAFFRGCFHSSLRVHRNGGDK